MKHLIALILTVSMLCSLVLPVFADVVWQCETCGETNEKNFCGNCGAARPSWLCPNCGDTNEKNFCGNCGMSQPAASTETDALLQLGPHTLPNGLIVIPRFMVDNRNSTGYFIYENETDTSFHLGDLSPDCRIFPALLIANTSETEQTFSLSTRINNGNEIIWDEPFVVPSGNNTYASLISAECTEPGDYTVEWFMDGVSVSKVTYTALPGNSDIISLVKSSAIIRTSMETRDVSTSEKLLDNLQEASLSMFPDENTGLSLSIAFSAPNSEPDLSAFSDKNYCLAVVINGKKCTRWPNVEIQEIFSHRSYSRLIHQNYSNYFVEGTNDVRFYLNGSEIATFTFNFSFN